MSVSSETKGWLTLAAVAVGGYFLYRAIKGVGGVASAAADAVAGGYNSAVDALSSGLFRLFGPQDLSSDNTTYYTVGFPDGSKHAISADRVNSDGTFQWAGYPDGSQPAVTLKVVIAQDGSKVAVTP